MKSQTVPWIEKSAGIEPSAALIENKLSAMQMSAQHEIESMARRRKARIMRAQNVTLGGQQFVFDRSISNDAGRPFQRLVFQPMPSPADHGFPHTRKSDPSIVVSADCGDGSRPNQAADKIGQSLESSPPINQVSTEQDNVRMFARHDVEKPFDNLPGAALSQVEIACEKNPFAQVEMRDRLATNQ
jgi:hypothetical protein